MLSDEDEYQLPAISEYQKYMRRNSNKLLNHVTTIHTEKPEVLLQWFLMAEIIKICRRNFGQPEK